jgi:transposase-like protein
METPTATPTPTVCRSCGGRVIRWGKDRGFQRWRCKACGASQTDLPVRPMGSMRIDPERAALILGMLTEGSSIRAANSA